jgi:EAL domain-containing protein (putative c-di-GMP-specific phosphodiesterase class I)
VQAGEFIPTAERTGLIVAIDRWVLREACRQGKAWLDAGVAPDRIAVNMSALHFKRALELEGDILGTLADTGLPPERLEIELTESGVMAASGEQNGVFSRLRRKGIKLAIDDFGTGYSSLDYLRRYPADRLKIPKAFIVEIISDPSSILIVKAITALSRQLGMSAIAEGIETSRQLEMLEACSCPEAQGFYFARPLGAKDILPLLQQGKIVEQPKEAAEPASRSARLTLVAGGHAH